MVLQAQGTPWRKLFCIGMLVEDHKQWISLNQILVHSELFHRQTTVQSSHSRQKGCLSTTSPSLAFYMNLLTSHRPGLISWLWLDQEIEVENSWGPSYLLNVFLTVSLVCGSYMKDFTPSFWVTLTWFQCWLHYQCNWKVWPGGNVIPRYCSRWDWKLIKTWLFPY